MRTPQEGLPVGDLLRLSGDYGQSSVEVTPQAMGIPQEAIDFFRLQNQKSKTKSYNVGITAFFPPDAVPEFMENVLRPTQARASFGQTRQSFRNIFGQDRSMSDRRRGIGGQAVLFDGPTVDVEYQEPNKFDRMFKGSVAFPMERGILSLYGSRALNEGRPDESSVGVRGKFSF